MLFQFFWDRRGTAVLEMSLIASILVLLMSAAFQFGYVFYLYSNMQNITRSVARDLALGKVVEQNTPSVLTYSDTASGETLVAPSPFNTSSDYVACQTAMGYATNTAEYNACEQIPTSLVSYFSVAASDENSTGPGVSGGYNVVSLKLDLDNVLFIDPFGFLGRGQEIERYSVIMTQ
jgi:Flp pilus assembly protein TadG